MQKTSRFSRLLTLVTAVALAVCLPVSAYAETETTEEAAAPAVVEEATQDNTADEAASEDSASCVRVVDVTIFMDTTKGHFESDPDNVALTYLNRAEFETVPSLRRLRSLCPPLSQTRAGSSRAGTFGAKSTLSWVPMLLNWAPAALVHSRLAAW